MQSMMDLLWLLLVHHTCVFYRILKENVFIYLWCLIKHIFNICNHLYSCKADSIEYCSIVVLELKKDRLLFLVTH